MRGRFDMDAYTAPDETLADVLGARARRTPPLRLLLDIIGGVLIGAVAIWAQPPGWAVLAAAAGCIVCYGCWAFSERHLHPSTDEPPTIAGRAWKAVWHVSGAVGLLAFVLLLFVFLGVALGKIIS
jgi:hypothetical protein